MPGFSPDSCIVVMDLALLARTAEVLEEIEFFPLKRSIVKHISFKD